MNPPRIIALTGARRSGKSTVAEYLVKQYNYKSEGFADPIRGMIAYMLNENSGNLERYKEDEVEWLGVTRRYLMQTLGTEWGRKVVSPNVWLLHAQRRWAAYERVVVPDMRFPNEAAFVQNLDATAQIWRVMRPRQYDPNDTAANHASETEGYKIHSDATLPNTGTIPDLLAKVKQLMEHSYGLV